MDDRIIPDVINYVLLPLGTYPESFRSISLSAVKPKVQYSVLIKVNNTVTFVSRPIRIIKVTELINMNKVIRLIRIIYVVILFNNHLSLIISQLRI